ncbi:unnamed protein product [Polarella glacialis]|uniref:UBX domain-containing protein n=1 Tax=Polarella glacialis TaxID=89957 RepID=A0A813JJH1_POLGL|nr:unnamed protein product [Polarella glacialis]
MQAHIVGRTVDEADGVTYYTISITLNGEEWRVRRRYTNFVDLDRRLALDRSLSRLALPKKDFLGFFNRLDSGNFHIQRQAELQKYLQHLLRQASGPAAAGNRAIARFTEVGQRVTLAATGADALQDKSSQLLSALLQTLGIPQMQATQQQARREELRRTEDEERCCLSGVFESKYGVAPAFFEGSFLEAWATARSKNRLLLLFLYSPQGGESGAASHPLCDALCQALGGEALKACVQKYFVLWGGDAERWLVPVQLFQLLRSPTLPSLLVLKPLSVYDVPGVGEASAGVPVEFPVGSAWVLLGGWDCASSGTSEGSLTAFLAEYGEQALQEAQLREQELIFQREYAEEGRILREQQDLELEESLQKDIERAEALEGEKRAAEEEAQRAEREAAERASLAVRRVAAATLLLAADSSSADAPTPSSGEGVAAAESCRLQLRLPGGQRAERSFAADEQLEAVYHWADCCGELSGLRSASSGRFEVPEKFQLATTYPRAPLLDRSRTLRDLQLLPNAILALNAEDDDDV